MVVLINFVLRGEIFFRYFYNVFKTFYWRKNINNFLRKKFLNTTTIIKLNFL